MRLQTGLGLGVLLVFCACWAASCASPLGPGYAVEQQEIRVHFAPDAQSIHIAAEYHLRNTGIRPIEQIEVLVPCTRRLHCGPATIHWDSTEISAQPAPEGPRNAVLRFAEPWSLSAAHTLRISYDVLPPEPGTAALGFSADAFYLPAARWSPELPQVPGLFGFGGAPPKKWQLTVEIPKGFLVHTSGVVQKTRSESSGEETYHAQQTGEDGSPFVVAGRYTAQEIRGAQQKVILWSRSPASAQILRQASAPMATTAKAYNAIFGAPAHRLPVFWIVECPAPAGCFSHFRANVVALLDEQQPDQPSAELASADTVMVDPSKGAPKMAAAAAPSLAASWLGYGRSPGFYEQTPPMSLLPVFAAAQSRERIEGSQVRAATIRRALRLIAQNPPPGKSAAAADQSRDRAKALLFFYGLQDHYGPEVFHNAISHMLYARAKRGFDLDDLIAAFEQETHQNVAQFVRLWLKHPDVPAEFRARYEGAASDEQLPPRTATTAANDSPFKGETP